jgi:tRNA U34 5-methylaminomethyl-2-thiouridine-forming methyltransferase MnmC
MRYFNSNTPPNNYSLVETDDGSFTFYSNLYDEACHSTSGAKEETKYNFLESSKAMEFFKSSPSTSIFEVGFGLGIGALEAFIAAKGSETHLIFYSMEIDEELVLWFINNVSDEMKEIFPFHQLKKNQNDHLCWYECDFNGSSLTIFIGDATKQTNEISLAVKPIDFVFQDAFSPRRNPTLWTKDWFSFLHNITNSSARLTTYSASHSVRENLLSTGWYVYGKKGFGQKRSMTVASKRELTHDEITQEGLRTT